jgi:hypothetical protein
MIAREPPPLTDPTLGRYLSHDSGGKGITIYMLDDGFDLTVLVSS